MRRRSSISFGARFGAPGKKKSLNSGIVLTGGGAILEGMPEIAEQIFDLPTRRGCPFGVGGLADHVNSPSLGTVDCRRQRASQAGQAVHQKKMPDTSQLSVQTLDEEARRLQRAGDHSGRALDVNRRILQIQPNHTAANNRLSDALLECGQIEEAEVAVLSALSVQPNNQITRNIALRIAAGDRPCKEWKLATYESQCTLEPLEHPIVRLYSQWAGAIGIDLWLLRYYPGRFGQVSTTLSRILRAINVQQWTL